MRRLRNHYALGRNALGQAGLHAPLGACRKTTYRIAPGELRSNERLGRDARDRCLSEAGIAKREDRSSSRRKIRRIVDLSDCERLRRCAEKRSPTDCRNPLIVGPRKLGPTYRNAFFELRREYLHSICASGARDRQKGLRYCLSLRGRRARLRVSCFSRPDRSRS
jgi:hypothetical protein